jgi:S-adenosylmethionine:tRNA ribosyltransferase-isomerase
MDRIQDFDYSLPDHLIAHTPLPRGESRLMVVDRKKNAIFHSTISELGKWLHASSHLVFNDTQVIRARLLGHRKTGGQVEIFLLHHLGEGRWECLLRPQKKLKVGETIIFGAHLEAEICQKNPELGLAQVQLHSDLPMWDAIEKTGHVPLPPYIESSQTPDANTFSSRYQTVFAQNPGAVAAPTAGLHFSEPLLQSLRSQGHHTHTVTLHVGYGTFNPVSADRLSDHQMHSEWYNVSEQTAIELTEARVKNEPILAVGTTVVRTLESAWTDQGLASGSNSTQLFITPGFHFRGISHLLTNFHLPKSTLLVLVSAFCGHTLIKRAYEEAVRHEYRFFSFGDAMLIL